MSFDPIHNNYLSHGDYLYLEELERSNRMKSGLLLGCFATIAVMLLVGGCQFMGWL